MTEPRKFGAESRADKAADKQIQEAESVSVPVGPVDEQINDDERKRFHWESRYPPKVVTRIRLEALYVLATFVLALIGILLTWRGDIGIWVTRGCTDCSAQSLTRYSFIFFAGVLGGSLFGLKYLYKVVARGWWNADRELWRLYSPFLAGGLAFAAGALAHAGLFGFNVGAEQSSASFVSLGFIAGYFADSASRKMQEIANILFGHPPHDSAKK